MAGYARAKRVTDPLNDRVKDLIVGKAGSEPVYASSGSEHGGEEYSPCLSDLIHAFLEDDAGAGGGGGGGQSPGYESDSERDPSMCDPTDVIEDLVNASIGSPSSRDGVSRELGYNAAICKTKWESSGGLTAGNYEFIDVVVQPDPATSQSHRYFIDLDFVAEFEIARPTDRYERLLEKLPGVFIGRGEELKEIVKVMSEAAKRSLKSRGLSLPPWRKNRYMQNKWFGPYRRTVNAIPANSPSVLTGFAVKCRSVGFDAVNGRLFFPATT
ncbi:hypothetical protein C3L33_07248, partial [Rhododendron williamsianum]